MIVLVFVGYETLIYIHFINKLDNLNGVNWASGHILKEVFISQRMKLNQFPGKAVRALTPTLTQTVHQAESTLWVQLPLKVNCNFPALFQLFR